MTRVRGGGDERDLSGQRDSKTLEQNQREKNWICVELQKVGDLMR